MSPPGRWLRLFRNPFRDRAEEGAVHEEIRFHLEELEERFVREGLPRDEARREALVRFGDPARWRREAARAGRATVRAEARRELSLGLRTDLRMAFRQMARNPRFTALLLIVMTVGVAAGTTVWAVVDAVLFKPLPFPEPERVVAVPG
ncbi:MAG: permease prefix domain 1-containing protein, partial [Gemmatimonadota bacterium]